MFGQGLIKGLEITLGRFFGKKQTVRYPDEKIPMAPRFHGRFELDTDKCIACGLCANACPNKVIEIGKEKVDKKQYLTKYVMRIEYCLFCGLCVESCNKDALKFSSVIDMNQYRRQWVRLTLVDREAPAATETPEEETPVKVAKAEAAAGQAPGKEVD
ncbi:MAG: 4Fe-4S dicluster domain-containing protein [Desulfocucumaceae bacterium]